MFVKVELVETSIIPAVEYTVHYILFQFSGRTNKVLDVTDAAQRQVSSNCTLNTNDIFFGDLISEIVWVTSVSWSAIILVHSFQGNCQAIVAPRNCSKDPRYPSVER